MILPSLNASNCGKLLRAEDTTPASNGPEERKNASDWTIRSQGTGKPVQGSTTTRSSLILRGMANLARTGRIIALAFALIWTSSLLPCVVKADVVNIRHDNKVLNSVVSLESVDVMNNLRGGEQSSEMLLHHKAMFGIEILFGIWVLWDIDQDVSANIPALIFLSPAPVIIIGA